MTDVKVEQCDKQAAFALLVGKKVGGGDGDTYVTRFPSLQEVEAAFARHRQAAEKAQQERDAGMIWRGIESAPKDGTVIMIFAPQGGSNPIHVGRWAPDWQMQRDGAHGHRWCIAEYQNLGKCISGHPTHWMPLPASPGVSGWTRLEKEFPHESV